jgi:hypothetical protein
MQGNEAAANRLYHYGGLQSTEWRIGMNYTFKITKANYDKAEKRLENLMSKTRYCTDTEIVKETWKEIRALKKAFEAFRLS